MDTMQAFQIAEANKGQPQMVFDWNKAASLIKERGAKSASAGLRGDWEWTGGEILLDGEPLSGNETYTYLSSNWAIPELDIEGDVIECWKFQREVPEWDAKTLWPESALKILNA